TQEAAAIHDWAADQNYSARGFSRTNRQCLPIVGAALEGRRVGTFQLALQKGIRSNAAGGHTLGFGVEQGGVSDIVRRRNKILKQRPQFRRGNMFRTNVAPAGHLYSRREVRER